MTALSGFPVQIDDRFATTSAEGLCPALCADVAPISSALSTMVVSDYGVRKAILDELNDQIEVTTLGVGESFYKQTVVGAFGYIKDEFTAVEMKSLYGVGSRFEIINNGTTIDVEYDSTDIQGIYTDNRDVQGGSLEALATIDGWAGPGYSPTTIWLSGNSDEDIAVAKIAVKIPSGTAFPQDGEIICIGISGNPGPSVPAMIGYFETALSSQLTANGEWVPITYSGDMYRKQYAYFTGSTGIVAYTSGVTLDTTTPQFLLRVFYDRVRYS